MYARVNDLAERVRKVAVQAHQQHLASLIHTYLPVEDEESFNALRTQVNVLRTLLKLRPSYNPKLVSAVNDLIREVSVVADSLRTV